MSNAANFETFGDELEGFGGDNDVVVGETIGFEDGELAGFDSDLDGFDEDFEGFEEGDFDEEFDTDISDEDLEGLEPAGDDDFDEDLGDFDEEYEGDEEGFDDVSDLDAFAKEEGGDE